MELQKSGRAPHRWDAPAAVVGREAGAWDSSCGRGWGLRGSSRRSSKRLSVKVWDFMSGWNHHIASWWWKEFQTESTSSVLVLQGGMGISQRGNLPEVPKQLLAKLSGSQ